MKIAAKNSPIPNGTLYCINVGSVMYILFALLSIDNIVLGAIKRSNPKNTEMPPMLTMYIILYFFFPAENNFMGKLNNHNSIY